MISAANDGCHRFRVPRLFALAMLAVVPAGVRAANNVVVPKLAGNLVAWYDFDHPEANNAARERDRGLSGTPLWLVNGAAGMRIADAAYTGAGRSVQTRQLNPEAAGNDDWKAGVFDADGVASLAAFAAVEGITLMGWIKPTGTGAGLDSTTPEPGDRYGAIGLFGLLSGTSEGHLVRALIEGITISDELRLVALGRRVDEGESLLLAADGRWEEILPAGEWTHIAATFDYDSGTMALYRNGEALPAAYTDGNDRWAVAGEPEPDVSSSTLPTGIKIGGSYPQNTQERNPFDGRFDDLMFFDRALTAEEVRLQFRRFGNGTTDAQLR